MKAILNGLQLAYKTTANSLYGTCGASVSKIYMKDIAACTTAVGREMLNFAKGFIETELANIVNSAKSTTKEQFLLLTEKNCQCLLLNMILFFGMKKNKKNIMICQEENFWFYFWNQFTLQEAVAGLQ